MTKLSAHVRLKGNQVEILGGAPEGRDTLNQVVSAWAGWSRRPAAVSLPGGGRCSVYFARVWESTLLPLLESTQVALDFDESAPGEMRHFLQQILVHGVEKAKRELDPPPSHHAPLKWTDEWQGRQPMPHQVQAIRALGAMSYRAILADDMGLGKSASSIWAWQQAGLPRCLVVGPKTVKRNWARELEATLRDLQVFVIDGTPKQRANQIGFMQAAMDTEDGRLVAIINYDLLHRLPDGEVKVFKRWVDGQFVIFDESHYLKNKKAERTKFAMQELAPPDGGAAARLCLSGTPVRNTLEDLWTQVQIVRPGTWSSFHQYEKFHLVRSTMVIDTGKRTKAGKAIKKTLNPVRASKNTEQLNAVINTLQVRRKKEDVLDLPPKIFTYPEFELDPPTKRIYTAMKERALIELAELGEDTPIFAPQARSALEATLRLEQIAQGFLGGIPENYLELVTPLLKSAHKIEGRPGHLVFPNSTKIEWLRETIDTVIGQGGAPVVFSRFNTPLFWLEKQWPGAATLHGGLNMEQRDAVIEKFQNNGIPVLFCQVKIAEGFNLTRSQDVIFYGRDWSPAINSQAADRCHRIGQTGTVNVQVPIVVGTFETYLHKKLKAKEADAEQALKRITIGELRKAL